MTQLYCRFYNIKLNSLAFLPKMKLNLKFTGKLTEMAQSILKEAATKNALSNKKKEIIMREPIPNQAARMLLRHLDIRTRTRFSCFFFNLKFFLGIFLTFLEMKKSPRKKSFLTNRLWLMKMQENPHGIPKS